MGGEKQSVGNESPMMEGKTRLQIYLTQRSHKYVFGAKHTSAGQKKCSTMQYHNDMREPSQYSFFLGLCEHFSCPDPDPMQRRTFGRK